MIRRPRCSPFLPILLLAGCAMPHAVISAPVTQPDTGASITFIHLNDSYRIDDVRAENPANKMVGGLGRVATVLEQLHKNGDRVELLHGGDFLFPSLEGDVFKGLKMVKALDYLHAMAPLTVVPGNHEFDKSQKTFEAAVNESKFRWIGSNIKFDTKKPKVDQKLEPAHWIDVGKHKVAVFGLTLSEPGQNEYVKVDPDYVHVAEKTIEALKNQGAEAIIALSHLISADDLKIAQLKQKYPELIWVASAHEHTSGFHAGNVNQAVITRGASNARTVWKIELSFDAQSRPQLSTSELKMDNSIAWHSGYENTIAKPTRQELLQKLPFLEHVVGRAAVDLDGREEVIRTRESTWGNYITDQMTTMFPDLKVDFAFLNGGSIRVDDIIRDDITIEDIWRSFGFPTPLRYMQLKGDDFRERVLTNAYDSSDPAPGRFLQFSAGIRVCVDTAPLTTRDKRVVQAQVPDASGGWRDIDDDELLAVVAPGYISEGGDDYDYGEKAVIATPAAGDAKYLILGEILEDTADGKNIGQRLDPANPRFAVLSKGQNVCFR